MIKIVLTILLLSLPAHAGDITFGMRAGIINVTKWECESVLNHCLATGYLCYTNQFGDVRTECGQIQELAQLATNSNEGITDDE